MSIFRSPDQAAAVTPDYTGLQIQTAVNALPIPIVWGESKLAPNVVWYNDFQSHPQSGSSGGKGGIFRTSGSSAGYTYTAAVIMALAEGPIAGINQIWRDQSVYTLSGLGLSLFTGTTPQTVWSYLASAYPSQALAYQGTAYVCAPNYNLSSSATLDNHNFEVQGFRFATGYGPGYSAVDADPSLIVSDFLVNAQYGVGFPPGSIDATTLFGSGGDASYQTYCRSVGLALSPALTNQEQASSTLARWLQLTNTAAVWSGGLLRFIPYGDAAVTGNGVTFNPNVTPVYNLTDDDFKVDSDEDPLQVSRTDPYQAYNVWRLEVAARDNAYNLTPIEARDQNAIELYGMRIASTVTAHEICDDKIAAVAAQLILQRALYIRNTYKFRLSWEYCLLDPMDLVTVTDQILGLSGAPIRITDIEEDENGFLQVTAEEFPLGAATATLYPVQQVTNNPINRNIAADPVNAPIVFEPPSALVGPTPQIWIAASGGSAGVADPNWGGANVWLSLDNISYSQVGVLSVPARQGVLSASLSSFSGTNPDTADTLDVDLSESGGVLMNGTALDAQLGNTLCLVDLELLSYETATLTSANEYALTTLYRGLYGTAAAAHASGAPFVRLDGAVFAYDLPAQYVSKTLYIKLQSFNIFGSGTQDISTCAVYSFTPAGVAIAHPVAEAIAVNTSLDFGAVTSSAATADDFGTLLSLFAEFDLDLGLA